MTVSDRKTGAGAIPWFRETELFTSGFGGYHTYRIPALVVAPDGSVLAICEGRRASTHDWGEINIVLRRSADNGATWQSMQVVAAQGDDTIGNPCALVDRDTGAVWLVFCKNNDEVFVTHSMDNGASWSAPREISNDVKPPGWTWYASGPGHGIQLSNGRLVVPCDHSEGTRHHSVFYRSHVIYSDDHGARWELGGVLDAGTDECEVIETRPGSVYATMRNADGNANTRLFARSEDGGITWTDAREVDDVVDPICQASIVGLADPASHGEKRMLFASPAGTVRENMTIRLSYDEGETWTVSKVLFPGLAGYSDLAVLPDGTICCLYERGVSNYRESIRLAHFNIEWITDGADHIMEKEG